MHGGDPSPPIVLCRTVKRGTKSVDCKFEGNKTLALFDASWQIKLVEAATGRVLVEKTFDAKAEAVMCPYSWKFDTNGTSTDETPPSQDVEAMAKPFLTP